MNKLLAYWNSPDETFVKFLFGRFWNDFDSVASGYRQYMIFSWCMLLIPTMYIAFIVFIALE